MSRAANKALWNALAAGKLHGEVKPTAETYHELGVAAMNLRLAAQRDLAFAVSQAIRRADRLQLEFRAFVARGGGGEKGPQP